MKKLLIVDTVGLPTLRPEKVAGTEITIVSSMAKALAQAKSKYDFDPRAWRKSYTPRPHIHWYEEMVGERRRAELAKRMPYWDAVMFFIRRQSELSSAIGTCVIAAQSGCKYLRIFSFSKESYLWHPLASEYGFSFCVGETKIAVTNESGFAPKKWSEYLQYMILSREGRVLREGMALTFPPYPPEVIVRGDEFFGKHWPGLPWKP